MQANVLNSSSIMNFGCMKAIHLLVKETSFFVDLLATKLAGLLKNDFLFKWEISIIKGEEQPVN